MLSIRLMVAIAFALPACVLAAADAHVEKERPEAVVKSVLEARFPDIKVVDVKPSVVPGIYEVFTGESIAYADATGEHLFTGALMETKSKRNLTAESIDERNAIDLGSLPFEHAIKTVKGNGKRRLVIFSDPECPFCQQLEKELTTVTDVTIYTFLYPLAELHPEAPAKAKAIWCAADKPAAWAKWMLERQLPAAAPCDATVIDANVKLGDKLRIGSTPTLFAGKGRRVSGVIATAQIESFLGPVQQPTAATGK